ncbi:hypothetical protein GLOTRDRAFT_29273, partial [Gloeophyllum trabeum ATCC 11539]
MLRDSPLLSGYSIPGIHDNVLVTLFADDTTIYLRENDRFDDLQNLLNAWCCASGAKFNKNKTEIIPIGSATHRRRVTTTRQLHTDDASLPHSIHIACDGEAVRSLGAWIGNKVNDITPWEPILDRIQHTLTKFQKSHPTLVTKALMVQWTIGGMTQYLAKVQGMPTNIVTALIKLTRRFIWNDTPNPPLALDQLYKDKSDGGIN